MSAGELPANYYVAGRDRQGNIRLRAGTGLLIAYPDHTRAEVERWVRNAAKPSSRDSYQAALDLLDREAVSNQGAHDDE